MTFALALLTLGFYFRYCDQVGVGIADCPQDHITLPHAWALTTVVALMVYVSGYQVGFGPISRLMISEVFPLNVRGAAMSLAAVVNFSGNILMNLTKEDLNQALTPAGVFF